MSPLSPASRVVILGGGHAGATVAFELRRLGFTGAVTLVSEEALHPYHRPPLSKAWLLGEVEEEDLHLRPAAWYAENTVEVRLATRATSLDCEQQRLTFSDGSTLGYDALVLCTGARARRLALEGAELDGIFYLRSVDDARRLRARLGPEVRIAVVGGGYVGLEAAASARKLGAQVTVLEREPRLLSRVAHPLLSDFYTRLHTSHGVELICSATAASFHGQAGKLEALQLADGRRLLCSVALVGVGAVPNEELAREAGLLCRDGVVVDENAHTSDPHVWAVGDVTRRPVSRYGEEVRLESVHNATEQARRAAHALSGQPQPAHEVPWFWSNQYDVRLQIVGLALGGTEVIQRGTPTPQRQSFSLFHLKGDELLAVEAVNATPDFAFGKLHIPRGARVDAAKLADPTFPLKETLR